MLLASMAHASPELDTVGVTLLRATDPTLIGSGVNVAQVEAPESSAMPVPWQVNPSIVFHPTNLFTYISADGIASNYPNALGTQSHHANSVAGNFFGVEAGVAPGVEHVNNYEANYFYESFITIGMAIQPRIVNQSFIFGSTPPQQTIDSQYDNYAAQNNTLFVSGAGNSGPPSAPSTAYNGISVAAFGGSSSVGPTADNGRSKPDITAPAGVTSFSTPLVTGGATVLLQAGLRGDAGVGTTSSATDTRTLKALLLNGAVKPSNWTHTATTPLDTRFGSGVLNVFNSYKQLDAGKFPFVESTTHSSGSEHLPGSNPGNVASRIGWDFNSLAGSLTQDRVNHYYFDLPFATAPSFTLTATLVWNRAFGQTSIKNLDLFLFNTANNSLVASSISTVDNVEHLFLPSLPAGRYDLQVFRSAGLGTETYALAFETFATRLNIARSGQNIVVSWPLVPDGFRLQSTDTLNPPISWTTVPHTFTTNENRAVLSPTLSAQFFRLIRP